MFSGIHLYALMEEIKKFTGKNVYGLRRDERRIYINTGKRDIFLSISPGKPFISINKTTGNEMLTSLLPGIKINSIEQIGLDRVLHIILDSGISIYIEVKSSYGNLIIVKENVIEWVLKNEEKRGIYQGKIYTPPPLPSGIHSGIEFSIP